MTDDRRESRDWAIAKHVDAIRALIRPDWVLAILAVDERQVPYFICPQEQRADLHALLVALQAGEIDVSGQL